MNSIIDQCLARVCRRYRYYQQHNASESILQLACIENHHFGMAMEHLTRYHLQLGPSPTPHYDAVRPGQRIEIKASRINLPDEDYRWTRLKPHHFDIAILVAIRPSGIYFYELEAALCAQHMYDHTLSYQATKSILSLKTTYH